MSAPQDEGLTTRPSSHTARIAVLDDDPAVREALRAVLESRGYVVTTLETLAEARDALSSGRLPDLLLADVGLPDGSGLDLVAECRDRGLDLPIVILSGHHEEQDYERGFAAGAVDYVAKPVSRDELLARCAVHLARPRVSIETKDLPGRDGLAFGRYQVVRELGRGGYGRVLLANDMAPGPGGLVALKALTDDGEAGERVRLRFIREAYTLARVQHENVARVRDFGSYASRYYLALEFVEGPSLRQYVAHRGCLAEPELRRLARGLLEALVAVDLAGLVHRDVKPDNVILRDGRIDRPVLVDFGLAKDPQDHALSDASTIAGTIAFMAPEVIQGRDADRRSDLFALGLALRFAAEADIVFPELTGIHLMQAIARRPIPPLEEGRLGRPFAAWLAGLLEHDPAARPPTPAAALEALDALPGPAVTRAPAASASGR